MAYTIDRFFAGGDFDQIEQRTREALAGQGFGVLTEIDISATLRAKLGEELPRYKVLGACNPPAAFEALTLEPRIGAVLPCNVVVRMTDDGVEVCAIDPAAAFEPIGNENVRPVADRVRAMLQKAIESI